MTDPETTFTVEVLGFASEADPEALAGSVSEFFGISIEEGRRLVKKRPIRVKRKASAAVAQQLVKQLRRLGADVLVRNEQTGEDRTYHAKPAAAKAAAESAVDADPVSSLESIPGAQPGPARLDVGPTSINIGDSIPPIAARAGADVDPSEETLESADSEIPTEAAPNVEVVTAAPISKSPRTDRSPVAAPEAPPSSDPERRDSGRGSMPSVPGVDSRRRRNNTPSPIEARPAIASEPGAEAPIETAEAPAPRPQSLPPPSAPVQGVPPATAGKLDFCGSCNRPVEKGDTCAKCGWNNGDKERRCRQCKKKLSVVSMVTRSRVSAGLFAAAVIAIGALVVLLLGPVAGVAAAFAAAALVVLGDALTVRYSCKTCTVAVYSERLMKEEETRIGRAKKKGYALTAASLVVGGALFAGSGASSHEIIDSSYGITWKLRVPGTNSHITGEVAQIVVPSGTKYARVQLAERPYLGGPVYFLIHYQHSYPSGPAELDKAAIVLGTKEIVKVYFAGQIAGELAANGDAFDGAFTGTFHNRPVHGRLRAAQYEHDMVIVAVVSGDEADMKSASIPETLGGLSVQRAAK